MTRINWINWVAAASSLVALGASQSGCTNVDCGTGTIDQNGECKPATDQTNNGSCGPGTKLGNTGQCEPVQVVQCDPGTTTAEEDPVTHVVTCVGTGSQGCQATISCPTPGTGKMTICGKFLDAETSADIVATNPTGKACDPANPTTDGPCSLSIRAYDAIDFAQNQDAATELPREEVVINDCGQFRIKNITITNVMYVGIGIGNNDKVATKAVRLTGVALPSVAKAVPGFPAYSVRITTDNKWSQAAFGSATPSFVDRGVYMGIFLHGNAPVSGVKITRGGTSTFPNDDYYFSDSSPASRATIDTAQTSTGADGSGLMIGANGNLTTYSGTGGETANCKWPSDLGDQITNVAFIQPRIEVQTASPTMLCP